MISFIVGCIVMAYYSRVTHSTSFSSILKLRLMAR